MDKPPNPPNPKRKAMDSTPIHAANRARLAGEPR
jgi:hypothetical protein